MFNKLFLSNFKVSFCERLSISYIDNKFVRYEIDENTMRKFSKLSGSELKLFESEKKFLRSFFKFNAPQNYSFRELVKS